MKWILVWWIVHPGHAQLIHMERGFENQASCMSAIPNPNQGAVMRARCSVE